MVSPSSIERILTVYQNPTKSACQPPKSADVSTFLKDHSPRKRPSDFNLPAPSAENASVQFQFTGALSPKAVN